MGGRRLNIAAPPRRGEGSTSSKGTITEAFKDWEEMLSAHNQSTTDPAKGPARGRTGESFVRIRERNSSGFRVFGWWGTRRRMSGQTSVGALSRDVSPTAGAGGHISKRGNLQGSGPKKAALAWFLQAQP